MPRRRLLVKSLRLSATLLVLALFALLSYRIVHGLSGSRAAAKLTRAITSLPLNSPFASFVIQPSPASIGFVVSSISLP